MNTPLRYGQKAFLYNKKILILFLQDIFIYLFEQNLECISVTILKYFIMYARINARMD
jgi:hypothetical protein